MPDFVTIARVSDLEPGGVKLFDVAGRRVALVNANGVFYAVDGRCPHQNVSMIDGLIVDDTIICPFHGSVFNLKTGAVVLSPAVDPIQTYPVEVLDGVVRLGYPGT